MTSNAPSASVLSAIHTRLKSGDVAGALADIKQITARNVNIMAAWQLQALIERAAGDLDAAITSFDAALHSGNATAELLNSYGNLRVEHQEFDLAETLFERAIALDAKYVPARINLGRLLSRLSLHEDAIAMLLLAVQLEPQTVPALVALGTAYRAAGEPELAVQILRKAADLEPHKPIHLLHLGLAHSANEDPTSALAVFEQAERAGLRSPELIDNRAAAFLQSGDITAAAQEYDGLVRSFPSYFAGHKSRARLNIEYGLTGNPFASYEELAQQYPSEPTVWQNWLAVLASYRKYDDVLAVSARAEMAVGTSPIFDFSKAVAFSELGQIQEASRSFITSTILDDNLDFLIARTRHFIRAGDYDLALKLTDKAATLFPQSQFAWAYRGLCWRLLLDEREFWLHDYENHVYQVPVCDTSSGTMDLEAIARALRKLHTARVNPADQSLRGGTQTEGALFLRKEPELRALRDSLMHAVQNFVRQLPSDDTHPFLARKSDQLRFAGSWSVRLLEQGFHIHHVHEEGWISSALHIVLPQSSNLDDPDASCLQLGMPPHELGLNLPPRRVIKPQAGALVLFPSSMWHGTVPFKSSGERLTVAFDVVPKR